MDNLSRDLFHQRKAVLLYALITRSNNVSDVFFKGAAVELLLTDKRLIGKGDLSREEILLRVEDVAGLRGWEKQWELLLSLNLLEPAKNGRYHLCDEIFLPEFLSSKERIAKSFLGIRWTREELVSFLFPPKERQAWTPRSIRSAILGGYRWLSWTIAYSMDPANNLNGLPAFWQCRGEGDVPMGFIRSVSISNALDSLATSHYFPVSFREVSAEHGRILERGMTWLLDCRVDVQMPNDWDEETRAWNQGGFLPYDDQPDSCFPTVDAAWNIILALVSLCDLGGYFQKNYGCQDARWGDQLVDVLRGGVQYVVRMQLPGGGWGIYRYMGDQYPVPASAFTTARIVQALHLALLTGLFEQDGQWDETGLAVEAALRQAWVWIRDRAGHFENRAAWTPFFAEDVEVVGQEDRLRAGSWIGIALLPLYRRFEDLRPEISSSLADLVAQAQDHWQVDHGRPSMFEFRPPLKHGLRDAAARWGHRGDVYMVNFLLECYNLTKEAGGPAIAFSDTLWDRMEEVVGNLMEEQHPEHGHWNEPVEGKPHSAATLMAIMVLQNYLKSIPHIIK